MRFVVFGSSVTRYAFDFLDQERAHLVRYFARSSLASVYSGQKKECVEIKSVASDFQKELIRADLENALPEFLRSKAFDYMIYDPVDERFDLLVSANGAICTASNEIVSGRAVTEADMHRVVSGGDEFFKLWELAWVKLVDQLDLIGKRSSLIINKVYWAKCTELGDGFEPIYTQQKIQEFNEFLDRLYLRMSKDVSADQFIEYDNTLFIGADDHKWGKGPFHYMAPFYTAFAKKIGSLQKKAVAPSSELTWVEDAAQELVERRLDKRIVLGFYNASLVDNSGKAAGKLRSNGQLSLHADHASAIFQGAPGSFEIKTTFSSVEGANGVSACYNLDGWEEIKYFAIGYSAPDGFRHIKITNPRQGFWDCLSFSEHDLVFGIQGKWQSIPLNEAIGDVRLYVKGTPSKSGGRIAFSWLSVWSEITGLLENERDEAYRDETISEEGKDEIADAILEYIHKCNPEVEKHSTQYLKYGRFPLTGEKFLDWPIDSPRPNDFESVGTYRYVWHSMQPALTLMAYAHNHENLAALCAARDYIADWLERSYFSRDTDIKYTWYDHGTAERLLAFLLMHKLGQDYQFDRRFMARLEGAITKHGQLLESEAFYAAHQASRYHNHAWFQDMALVAAGQLLSNLPCAERWLQKGIDRLTDQFDKLIVRDQGYAIFVENSIGYHLGVQRLAEFAGKLVSASGKDSCIPDVAKELNAWSEFLRYPDGRRPSQGDTFRKANPGDLQNIIKAKPYKGSCATILSRAGYAVVKGNHDNVPFMLCMFATSLCKTHKHEDNLSITLFFDDVEWLVDPSFYSHDYAEPIPAYLRSSIAHNNVVIENACYSREPGTAMLKGSTEGKLVFISGESLAYDHCRVERGLEVAMDSLSFKVSDAILGKLEEGLLVFHLGEGVKPSMLEDGTIELSHSCSDYELRIEFIDPSPVAGASFVEGKHDLTAKNFVSLIGHGFMEAVESFSIVIPMNKKVTWHLTSRKV